MNRVLRGLGWLLVLALMGCATEPEAHSKAGGQSTVAVLYGVERQGDQLHLRVRSSGCTQPEHFELVAAETAGDYVVRRLQADPCRRLVYVIGVSIPLPADMPASFRLVNPLVVE